jgi:hypothetical protein
VCVIFDSEVNQLAENLNMKNTLLTSVAILFVGATASFAAMPTFNMQPEIAPVTQNDMLLLADSGSDDRDDDDNDSDDNDDDDNDDDDRSDNSNDDARSNSSNDNSPQSKSKRRKKRIPGGSGCDDAGDLAEHPECRTP